MKLILSSPTYGPVEPLTATHLRAAVMHAAAHGVEWVGDASPDRVKWDAARNLTVKTALESEAEAIFWCDADIVLPTDAITRLVATGEPFITGIYFQRGKPHWPLIAHFDARKQTFNWFIDWPANVVAPIDGCGFGCVLTTTAMFRAIDPPWFAFHKFSEDFDVCLKAARAGWAVRVYPPEQNMPRRHRTGPTVRCRRCNS